LDRSPSPERIVLIGMMGSGKSTIGHLIADAKSWPLFDNDLLLGELTGLTARELLAASGLDALREAEESALVHGLAKPPPCVVDAAAGTVESARVRGLLLLETVVWLRARPETLYARSSGAAHRPWLDGGIEWFRTKAADRAPLYDSVADIVVDTDDRTPEAAAQEILASLET
jgi:shikimate kinase